MKVADLFTGIGGFTLALEPFQGFQTAFYCDIDWRSQAVIKRRISSSDLPKADMYSDVRRIHVEDQEVDMMVGGFPCTGFSCAGNCDGTANPGSALVSEVYRLVEEGKPKFVMLENVSPILSYNEYRDICERFVSLGYDISWIVLTAKEFGAPHKRSRWWALCSRKGLKPGCVSVRLKEELESVPVYDWKNEPRPRLSENPQNERCFLLGNTLVPCVARVAFLSLFTGMKHAFSELLNKREWTFDLPTAVSKRPSSKQMHCGTYREKAFWTVQKPKNDLGLFRPLDLVINPKCFRSTKERAKRNRMSPYETEKRRISLWSTPRTCTHMSNYLTKRSRADLPTQMRFEITTENRHYQHVNGSYLDWMQGYPMGWTDVFSKEK